MYLRKSRTRKGDHIMQKPYHLTQEGVKELKEELAELIALRGPIAERIRTAREFGDLSENAEYSSAREEQGKTESRISEIENILQNVEIIKQPSSGAKKVSLGSSVTLKSGSVTKKFKVVGTVEADPLEGKISDESPIGKALLGKNLGDDVEIETPAETVSYTIDSIS